MDRKRLEEALAELPLYIYDFIDPKELEFSQRIRYICKHDCQMYDTSWACPPAVGPVAQCKARCLSYESCLMISTITEVADISDIQETLSTRADHEMVTEEVCSLLKAQGAAPYVLSTESCALCSRCAYRDGLPCRRPDKMHPCVESHGINIIPSLEKRGLNFQYGSNIVTWVSLLFF